MCWCVCVVLGWGCSVRRLVFTSAGGGSGGPLRKRHRLAALLCNAYLSSEIATQLRPQLANMARPPQFNTFLSIRPSIRPN
jgi:hypothetical protein